MFYLGWVLLTATGIVASLGAFIWALRTGQFSDQNRARYLPLGDELSMPAGKDPAKLSIEVYVLIIVFGFGVLAMGITIFLTLFPGKG
jgi:cbb3-type cytochrome oxidase maturation protein